MVEAPAGSRLVFRSRITCVELDTLPMRVLDRLDPDVNERGLQVCNDLGRLCPPSGPIRDDLDGHQRSLASRPGWGPREDSDKLVRLPASHQLVAPQVSEPLP